MNKKELIDAMAAKAGMTAAEAGRALDAFVVSVGDALKAGDTVQLVGVLSLKVAEKPERVGRNPSTGEKITIPAKKVIKFKAGKALEGAL